MDYVGSAGEAFSLHQGSIDLFNVSIMHPDPYTMKIAVDYVSSSISSG